MECFFLSTNYQLNPNSLNSKFFLNQNPLYKFTLSDANRLFI